MQRRKRKIAFAAGLTAAIILCLLIGGWYYMFRLGQGEQPTAATSTNTDPAVYSLKKFEKVLDRFPDFARIADLNNLDAQKEYGTYIIPGLKATKTILTESAEIDMCTTMNPEGLAITDDYIIISSYCHDHVHHSVLYMIDKESHQFLREIVLPDQTHAGGLTYDDKNDIIWVSGYKHKTAYANAMRLDTLETYSLDEMQKPIKYLYQEPLKEIKRNSFMTYKEGYLYAGYFAQNSDSVIEKYRIEDDGGLALFEEHLSENEQEKRGQLTPKSEESASISSEVQGIAFMDDYLVLVESFGWKPSKMLILQNIDIDDGIYDFTDHNAIASYTLPDRLEYACFADDKIYMLYESASSAYRHRTMGAMDRVITFDIDEILEEHNDE